MRTKQKYDIWKSVEKKGEGDCWPCTLTSRDKQGHRIFNYLCKHEYAHRVVYELTKGLIPEGFVIGHLCNNPSCCNPAHLEALTKSQNTKQAYEHNPNALQNKMGVNNGRSKLTEEQVKEIRLSTDSHAACARRYGVNESTIGRIRKYLRYAS